MSSGFTYRSKAEIDTGTTTPMTFTVPSGVVDGDLLFLVLTCDFHGLSPATPANWTALPNAYTQVIQRNPSTTNQYHIFYRSASGEPGSYSIAAGAGGSIYGGLMVAYMNPNAYAVTGLQNEADVSGTEAASTTATATTGTSADDAAGTLFYAIIGQGTGAYVSASVNAAVTKRSDFAITTGPANRIAHGWADEPWTTGSYPARATSMTWASNGTGANVVRIRIPNTRATAGAGFGAWAWIG